MSFRETIRRAWLPRLTLLIAVLLGGCDRGSNPSRSSSSQPVRPVRLGYFANLTHAQAVLGVASGDFAKAVAHGTMSPLVFNAGPSLIEALFAGEIDVGYIGPGPAINGFVKSGGQGLRIIAGAAANGVAIIARRDAGIATLEDLKGKRVATPQLGNTQDIAARHYLTKVLGQSTPDNVLPVPNAEQLSLMERGQIDAAWAPEPWASRLIVESGGVLLAEEKDLWDTGRFTLALVITTPEFLRQHPETVRKLLEVHVCWTRRLRSEPRECLSQLGRALNDLTGKSIPAEAFAQAFERTEFTNEPLEQTLRTFAEWSYELGFSRSPPELTGLVDTTVLQGISDHDK